MSRRWERDVGDANAGYGITAVLEGGSVLEKAAANVSVVRGVLSAERAAAMSSRGRAEIDSGGGQPYSAVAMSLVFHTATPWIPTLRADVRMFEVCAGPSTPRSLNNHSKRALHVLTPSRPRR